MLRTALAVVSVALAIALAIDLARDDELTITRGRGSCLGEFEVEDFAIRFDGAPSLWLRQTFAPVELHFTPSELEVLAGADQLATERPDAYYENARFLRIRARHGPWNTTTEALDPSPAYDHVDAILDTAIARRDLEVILTPGPTRLTLLVVSRGGVRIAVVRGDVLTLWHAGEIEERGRLTERQQVDIRAAVAGRAPGALLARWPGPFDAVLWSPLPDLVVSPY